MSNKVDVHATSSDRIGVSGKVETFLRKFRGLTFTLILLPIFLLYIFCLGVSLTPAVLLVYTVHVVTANIPIILYFFAIGFAIAVGFFCFGFTLILIVPLVNYILRLKPKPWRGSNYSLETIPWYYHNALTFLVRYTFLEFVTPTPINVLFYRLMGMRIGKGVQIATTNITDPCLITLEDHVYIGGSASLIGHYSMKGYLIIAPIHIKQNTTIGLKASILGDVVVGENCIIKPHTVLMPKTRIKNNTTI